MLGRAIRTCIIQLMNENWNFLFLARIAMKDTNKFRSEKIQRKKKAIYVVTNVQKFHSRTNKNPQVIQDKNTNDG